MNVGPPPGVLLLMTGRREAGTVAPPMEYRMTSTNAFRWSLALTSSAWFAFTLDRLVVNTALPVMRADFHASLAALQWTVNA